MFIKTNFIAASVLLFTAVFFAGCKKDNAHPPTSAISNVKSTITTSATGLPDTVTYAYDSTGRQVMSQTDSLVTTYTYATGTVTMNYMLAGEDFVTTYTTNAAGQATSDSKGNIYVYDNNGYLISMSYTHGGQYDSTSYLISGSNTDSTLEHQVNASTNNYVTTIFTFTSVKDTRNFGLAFLGKPNTNLINTETITQVNNGSSYTEIYTYSYTYDAQGRISQQIQTNGSATYTTTYTY